MKRMITSFTLVMFVSLPVFANEQWLGTFNGKETIKLTNCKLSQYNGSSERDWSVTHEEIDGNTYSGIGKVPGEPKFTVEGQVNGNTATGKAKGKDNWGNAWWTKSEVTLEGDTLKVTYTGNSPATGCDLKGEITATRQ